MQQSTANRKVICSTPLIQSSPFSSASLVDDEAKEFTFADEALASVIRGHLEKSKAVGVQDEDNSDCDLDDFDPDVRGCLSV